MLNTSDSISSESDESRSSERTSEETHSLSKCGLAGELQFENKFSLKIRIMDSVSDCSSYRGRSTCGIQSRRASS